MTPPRVVVTPSATHLATSPDVALCGARLTEVVRTVAMTAGLDLGCGPFDCSEYVRLWRAWRAGK